MILDILKIKRRNLQSLCFQLIICSSIFIYVYSFIYLIIYFHLFNTSLHQALSWTLELSLRIQRWIQVARDGAVREEWATLWRTLSAKEGWHDAEVTSYYLISQLSTYQSKSVTCSMAPSWSSKPWYFIHFNYRPIGVRDTLRVPASPIRTLPLSHELYIAMVYNSSEEEFQPKQDFFLLFWCFKWLF